MQLKEPLPPSVKPPYPPHTVVDNPQYKATPVVKIYHPVYPSKYKPLAQFLALDDGGIDYDLAYYACCLLLDNAWTRAEAKRPYFSLTPVPKLAADRVARGPDGILPAGDYYFYDPEHPDLDKPYPIVPSFAHWSFPHGNLPPPWRDLNIAPVPAHKISGLRCGGREAIIARDECCRVTQAVTGVEKAHIVPKAEAPWFTDNKMDPYVWTPDTSKKVHDVKNLFLLRADVHKTFDAKQLLIFPKLRNGRRMLVLHVLHSATETIYELEELYHNRLLHQLYGVSPEFLFARFAWTILDSITIQLLDTDKPEPIAVRIREDAKGQKSPTSRVIYVTGSDQIPPSTSARSVSKKRTRSVDDAAAACDDSDSDDSDRETRWDSRVGKRREVDSDSEGSADSEFEDFSRPVKRGRTSARPVSLAGSLATLPCSTRSNSSAATKIDAAIDPKVSGFNPETGEIVPVKRLD